MPGTKGMSSLDVDNSGVYLMVGQPPSTLFYLALSQFLVNIWKEWIWGSTWRKWKGGEILLEFCFQKELYISATWFLKESK